jgi:hypothetical protein
MPSGGKLDYSSPGSGRIQGKAYIDGQAFDFASGGAGRGNLPAGLHPVDFKNIGPAGRARLGSVASVGPGGTLHDPRYPGRPRLGIQIHSGSGATLERLRSLGCFVVPRAQWPAYKAALLAKAARTPGGLNLDLGRNAQGQWEAHFVGRGGENQIAGTRGVDVGATRGAGTYVKDGMVYRRTGKGVQLLGAEGSAAAGGPAGRVPEAEPFTPGQGPARVPEAEPFTPSKIDGAISSKVQGSVNVNVVSNGTAARTGVKTDGALFQESMVRNVKLNQMTDMA